MRALRILLSILICLLIGFLSGQYSSASVETWYITLDKPAFNPPDWVFAPVWTILYILMGIAGGMIWNTGIELEGVRKALLLFIIQLLLNAIWAVIFFGMQNPPLALVEILFLFLAIYLCTKEFSSLNKQAGWLMIPYLLWVGYATILNLSIVILNSA